MFLFLRGFPHWSGAIPAPGEESPVARVSGVDSSKDRLVLKPKGHSPAFLMQTVGFSGLDVRPWSPSPSSNSEQNSGKACSAGPCSFG